MFRANTQIRATEHWRQAFGVEYAVGELVFCWHACVAVPVSFVDTFDSWAIAHALDGWFRACAVVYSGFYVANEVSITMFVLEAGLISVCEEIYARVEAIVPELLVKSTSAKAFITNKAQVGATMVVSATLGVVHGLWFTAH